MGGACCLFPCTGSFGPPDPGMTAWFAGTASRVPYKVGRAPQANSENRAMHQIGAAASRKFCASWRVPALRLLAGIPGLPEGPDPPPVPGVGEFALLDHHFPRLRRMVGNSGQSGGSISRGHRSIARSITVSSAAADRRRQAGDDQDRPHLSAPGRAQADMHGAPGTVSALVRSRRSVSARIRSSFFPLAALITPALRLSLSAVSALA